MAESQLKLAGNNAPGNCNITPSCCGVARYGYPSACFYGQHPEEHPPCGSKPVSQCPGNCWDTSLCYLPEPVCEPGDLVATVQAPASAARLSNDARAALSIYNYSVQRVVSRTLKFIASYSDWVYQQGQNGSNEQGGSADNDGNLPYADLSSTVFSTLGWYAYNVSSVKLCDCFCRDMCGLVQLVIGLDSSSTIRNFVLDNALNCCGPKTELGCGRSYQEETLVQFGRDVCSIADLIIHILRTLDAHDNPARAEAILKKFCRCIIQAAGADKNTAQSDENSFTTCDEEQAGSAAAQRRQAFAFMIDHIQYLLFDRDCDFPAQQDDCTCCPELPNLEQWVDNRCRRGTGEGKCLVCSAGCSKYRRRDDFKTMLSTIYGFKFAFQLLTLPRDGDYTKAAGDVYQNIIDTYAELYSGESGTLTFYPDCAAPTFCCSAENILRCINNNGCCTGTSSTDCAGVLQPRIPDRECGDGCVACPTFENCECNTDSNCCNNACPNP